MHRFSTLIFPLLISISAVAQVRDFPCRVDALPGDMMKTDVWDFSQQLRSDDRNGTIVQVYGDSLLAETIESRRYWYSLTPDSVFFCGEEDRLTSIRPDSAVSLAPRPLLCGFSNGNVTFNAHGTGGGKRFSIMENVTIENSASIHTGILILAPGDSVRNALAVKERRFVSAFFPDDSIASETQTMTETVRWYDSDGARSLLPLAIQYYVYSPYLPTSEVPTFSVAYLPERSEYVIKDSDFKDQPNYAVVERAIDQAIITCDGNTVSVSCKLPQSGLILCLDIVDAAGHGYIHQSAVSDGAENELSVDCSSLRNGEYIAVLSVENIPAQPKKELVIIR